MNFFSFFFDQYTALSSRAVDGHQMYFGASVAGKASTIGIEISPTPPLIFTGGQKVRNLATFKTSLNFEPHAFENAARYPNSETTVQCCDDRPMSWPSLVKFGPHS